LWDKVYQKVTDPADETWLLRAAEAAFKYYQTPISKSESLRCASFASPSRFYHLLMLNLFRAQFGLVFVHLAAEGKSPQLRKLVNDAVASLMNLNPRLTGAVVREALTSYVSHGPPKSDTPGEDGPSQSWNKHSRLSALLLSAATFSESASAEEKGNAVAESVILANHPMLCGLFVPIQSNRR
jgi:Generalcontrol nonderepressible 1 (Gcn1) N-terminal